MACIRNCSGTSLCNALNLCCIQFRQGCGKECNGLAEGQTSIQPDINGNLIVCSNVGGVCTCQNLSAIGGVDTLVDNDDGTFTHTNVDGDPVTIDICDLISDAITDWTPIPLSAGWVARPGYQAPEYRQFCDTVQLRGCVFHDDADDDNAVPETIGTLPVDFRPPAAVVYWGGANCSTVEIDVNGVITTDPSAPPFTRCFDGDSFSLV